LVLGELGLAGAVDEEALLAATYARFDAALPRAGLMPGALAALAALPPGLPSAIVTSSTRAQAALKRDYFPAVFARARFVVSVTDVEPLAKPDGLPYALAAAALGADVAACVVVEDSVPGTRAGVAVGAFVVAVPAAVVIVFTAAFGPPSAIAPPVSE
jgi:HAD superfamily hydrolase (TIGR01509 family)